MDRPAAEPAAPGGAAVSPQDFAESLERLIGADRAATGRFLLAVSGGPDSMALLALAAEACPGRIAVATVDHRLRADSAAEAAMVARLCGDIAVPHATLVPDRAIAGSVQAAARAARYALLEAERVRTGCDWLLTAHHADDQLETLLMRANRGSGTGGMAGIRARNGHILRPLLLVRRDALAAVVSARGWPSVDDPSNRDARFDRARLRAALAGSATGPELDPVAFARTAAALDEADSALGWITDQLAQSRIANDAKGLSVDLSELPPELARRLLTRTMARAADTPRGESVTRALAALASGRATTLGTMRLSMTKSGHISIRPAPPRRTQRGD